jgi:DnaJ like chaperone protein
MGWMGKIVGGIIGAIALGPLGAAVGALLGHQFDEAPSGGDTGGAPPDAAGALAVGAYFFRSTFEVMGHLAKADGRVSQEEIKAARAVMSEFNLDPAHVREAIECFTAGKQPGFDLEATVLELRRMCAGRPDLLRTFLEIQMRAALQGVDLRGPARQILQRIGGLFGIYGLELAHMEAVLRIRSHARAGAAHAPAKLRTGLDPAEAYAVLELGPDAADEDIVKAYRRQLSRHHPDKLKANGLPESMLEHAKQRTQQIIEAYELLRERRGMH